MDAAHAQGVAAGCAVRGLAALLTAGRDVGQTLTRRSGSSVRRTNENVLPFPFSGSHGFGLFWGCHKPPKGRRTVAATPYVVMPQSHASRHRLGREACRRRAVQPALVVPQPPRPVLRLADAWPGHAAAAPGVGGPGRHGGPRPPHGVEPGHCPPRPASPRPWGLAEFSFTAVGMRSTNVFGGRCQYLMAAAATETSLSGLPPPPPIYMSAGGVVGGCWLHSTHCTAVRVCLHACSRFPPKCADFAQTKSFSGEKA